MHPVQLRSVAVVALPVVAATIIVAAFLAALNSELFETSAAQIAGVPFPPVDPAACSLATDAPGPPSASPGRSREQVWSLALLTMSLRHGNTSPTPPPQFA